MNRRTFLATGLALLPATLAYGGSPEPIRLPVPGDALAGCLLPYREALPTVYWDQAIAEGCAGWAAHLADAGFTNPDGTPRHSLAWPAQECIAAGQQDWVEALHAWIASPAHLAVLQHTRATRVGMAGVRRTDGRPFWVLRVKEER